MSLVFSRLALGVAFTLLPWCFADAQTAPQPAVPAPVAEKTELPQSVKVEIVITRYAGEKRVSSQPYTLMTVANGELKSIRTGAEVPLPNVSGTQKESYKSIGTVIACRIRSAERGVFRTDLSLTSSSVYPEQQKQPGPPAFRTFSLAGEAYLTDGQTVEIASATDGVTGEVVKAEVTLRVVK